MAIIRKKDLKAMGVAELKSKLADLEKEIATDRFSSKQGTGKPSNTGRIRALKRLYARIKTFLRQKGVKD